MNGIVLERMRERRAGLGGITNHHGLKASVLAMGLALGLLSAAPAGAADCVKAAEAGALEVRLVQTELMVAALTCKRKTEYNRFVRQFEPVLMKRGRTLQALFKRLHGRQATKRLNGFVTRLANEASLRSIRNSTYCSDATALFDEILSLQPADLGRFAANLPFSRSHGLPLCKSGAQMSSVR